LTFIIKKKITLFQVPMKSPPWTAIFQFTLIKISTKNSTKKEGQNMQTNVQKNTAVFSLSFLIILACALTSCQKEQQLAQPGKTDQALQSNLFSRSISAAVLVNGGGQGTFNADLDGDSEIDGSHFGIGVSITGNGVANGHFECNMAGNADILGLHLMAVEGKVSNGSINANGGATFSGLAAVNLGNGQIFRDVPFSVTVTAGGTGVGSLTLTVMGAFDGVPGDTNVGNGNYDLPTEMVNSGQIRIQNG
jgi:hypothetical protein